MASKVTGYHLEPDVVEWIRAQAVADNRSASNWLETLIRQMMREEESKQSAG